MKHDIKVINPKFTPIEVTITLENPDEFFVFALMLNGAPERTRVMLADLIRDLQRADPSTY